MRRDRFALTSKPKQTWAPGATVRVGFLELRVIERVPTPADGLPDEWLLESLNGIRYSFIPHNGLVRL